MLRGLRSLLGINPLKARLEAVLRYLYVLHGVYPKHTNSKSKRFLTKCTYHQYVSDSQEKTTCTTRKILSDPVN